MDFSKLDSRTAAETPSEMQILHQSTGEPIINSKGEPCLVLVRGTASRSAQREIRAEEAERLRKAKSSMKTKPENKSAKAAEDKDIQKNLCDSAARFICGFVNVQRPDEKAKGLVNLTDSKEDIAWFLDLNMVSIPHLLRGDGAGITQEEDESDEGFIQRRSNEMDRWLKPSFAQQVIDHAREDANFLEASEEA